MPEENAVVETAPVAPVVDAPAPVADTVITEGNENNFTSAQLAEALENMKAGKVQKTEVKAPEAPKGVKVDAPEAPKVETPAVTPEAPAIDFKAPEPTFDQKVAQAVAAEIKRQKETPEAVAKPPAPEFQGYKTQEELQAAWDKDPKEAFNKTVEWQVKREMAKFKAEFNESVQPLKQELDNKQVNLRLDDARAKVPELKDQNFTKQVADYMKEHAEDVDAMHKRGENPYVNIAEIVRGKNVALYEKAAYARAVKETEARFKKEGRAVVEGSGKTTTVDNDTIDLDKASSAEIATYLRSYGKAI